MKWVELHPSEGLNFVGMLTSGKFADVNIICLDWEPNSGKDLRCHRVILSNSSELFNFLFLSKDFPSTVFIPVKHELMKGVIKLIYGGSISVSQKCQTIFMETCRMVGLKNIRCELVEKSPKNEPELYADCPSHAELNVEDESFMKLASQMVRYDNLTGIPSCTICSSELVRSRDIIDHVRQNHL